MPKRFDWLTDCLFDADTWHKIEALARKRGIRYPRAREQPDGSYLFMSGMTREKLFALRDEVGKMDCSTENQESEGKDGISDEAKNKCEIAR